MKKILFLTGTRADFGKIKKLMGYVEIAPDLELHVLVTGMHMMRLYGETHREVRRENYRNIYLIANQHENEPMCSVLGNTVSIVSRIAREIAPDLIVVHGDRLEALAGATVGALSNTLVCHIEGGELSGTVDEIIRHSVSKLSHVHLVANSEAKKRLVQMGELEKNVHIIGSPDLDVMSSSELPSLQEVKEHYNIGFDEYAVSLFHPVTTEEEDMHDHAKSYFRALKESGQKYVIIYPNNDTGNRAILDALQDVDAPDSFLSFPSIRFEYFLTLLKNAKFMIGNSSAGIREAPFYGVPTVNVGTRQNKRFLSDSVVNTSYFKESILDGINAAVGMEEIKASQWFGDGSSLEKFKKIIHSEELWLSSVQKSFVDMEKMPKI